MKLRLICLLFATLSCPLAWSQPASTLRKIDSLNHAFSSADDTTKAKILSLLGRIKLDYNEAEAVALLQRSVSLSKELNYKNQLTQSYCVLGGYYLIHKADFKISKLYLDSALNTGASGRYMRTTYYSLGMWHAQRGEFDESQRNLQMAIKANGSQEDSNTAMIYDVMGYNLEKIGRKKESLRYRKRSIGILEKKGISSNADARNIASRLNSLGAIYMEMDILDTAFFVFRRIYHIEKKFGNPWDNAGLLANLGKVYFKTGMHDSAYYFLHTALRAPSLASAPHARIMCLSLLARYHLLHDPDSAIHYSKVLTKENKNDLLPVLEDLNYILSQAYAARDKFDSAFLFQSKYNFYHDSLFEVNRKNQIAELEAEFELASKEKEITRLQKAEQEANFRRNVFAVGFFVAIILAILTYYIFRIKIQARRKEIESKNTQLENFTAEMIAKSALVDELRIELDRFKSENHISNDKAEYLSRILNYSIITEYDWEKFKVLFEHVYPKFFASLKIKYPLLSASEIRLSALLKLNLSTREIANMLGISAESANTARYRLRKKLDLQPEQDLLQVMENIS